MAMYKTKKDAAYAWVQEFNAIPQSVIEKLAKVDLEENGEGITEITPPSYGDRVYIFSGDTMAKMVRFRATMKIKTPTKFVSTALARKLMSEKMILKSNVTTSFRCGERCGSLATVATTGGLKIIFRKWQIADSVSTSKRILSTFSALMVVATTFMRLIGFRFMKSVVFIGMTKL